MLDAYPHESILMTTFFTVVDQANARKAIKHTRNKKIDINIVSVNANTTAAFSSHIQS